MRRAASQQIAKEAPQLDQISGKCSENAHLSTRAIIVFFQATGATLHSSQLVQYFTATNEKRADDVDVIYDAASVFEPETLKMVRNESTQSAPNIEELCSRNIGCKYGFRFRV